MNRKKERDPGLDSDPVYIIYILFQYPLMRKGSLAGDRGYDGMIGDDRDDFWCKTDKLRSF